jgi:hypothetical protein
MSPTSEGQSFIKELQAIFNRRMAIRVPRRSFEDEDGVEQGADAWMCAHDRDPHRSSMLSAICGKFVVGRK